LSALISAFGVFAAERRHIIWQKSFKLIKVFTVEQTVRNISTPWEENFWKIMKSYTIFAANNAEWS